MGEAAPLRILHLTAGSDAGGISRYLYNLCMAMHQSGHEVAVAGEPGEWHDLFQTAPWPWIDLPLKSGPLGLARAAATLREWIAQHPVDVLHTHYRKATLVARRLQRKLKLPILYTLHLSHIPLGWPWRWFTDFGDHVHVPSSNGRDWLVRHARVAAGRITVIPHGIDPARFPLPQVADRAKARSALELHANDRAALFVGRLDNPKNEDWMLDLAAKQIPHLQIFIAGDGPHFQQLQNRIYGEGLSHRVKLLGHCDPLPLYHAGDALLLPSAREGFSYVCAEAMCTGLPVLRTRTSGTAELIVEGVTGRSVPIDHRAFLDAAVDFLADEKALRRMGTAAAHHVRQHLTFTRQFQQTIALYHRFAGRPCPKEST